MNEFKEATKSTFNYLAVKEVSEFGKSIESLDKETQIQWLKKRLVSEIEYKLELENNTKKHIDNLTKIIQDRAI